MRQMGGSWAFQKIRQGAESHWSKVAHKTPVWVNERWEKVRRSSTETETSTRETSTKKISIFVSLYSYFYSLMCRFRWYFHLRCFLLDWCWNRQFLSSTFHQCKIMPFSSINLLLMAKWYSFVFPQKKWTKKLR